VARVSWIGLSRIYAIVSTASIAAAIILPIAGAIAVRRIPSSDQLIATAWITMAIGILGFIGALAVERGKMRRWMISGLAAGALAWSGWEYGLWSPEVLFSKWSPLRGFCIALSGWAVLMAFAGLLQQVAVPQGSAQHVRRLTVGVAACFIGFLSLMLIIFFIAEPGMRSRDSEHLAELIGRASGVLGVLTLAGTLGVLASALVPRIGQGRVPESMRRDLTVTCPRCGRGQSIRSHGDACGGCGLHIKVVPL